MKARKTHYLISTHQISGVYNSPLQPPNPSAKEIELRNVRPLSHRSRQRLRAQLPSDAAEILNHSTNIRTLSRQSKSAPLPPISMKTAEKVQVLNMQLQKISILSPTEGFLFCAPLLLGNSSLASYFASKILTFKIPLPPRNFR